MLIRPNFKKIALVYIFLAVAGVLVVLFSSPKSVLERARDGQRFSELSSIDKAIDFAVSQNPNLFQGEPNVVYLSLPDLDNDGGCLEHTGLPFLSSGWRYACATEANLSRVDGKGWIPVQFDGVPIPPLDLLPADPLNNAASGFYYSYAPGWEINARLESAEYNSPESEEGSASDGGNTNLLYEVGNSINLMPAVASDRTGEAVAVLKMSEDCNESFVSVGSFFTKWRIPGSGVVTVTKFWYFQPDESLADGETLDLAIYNAGLPNYIRLSEAVKVLGRGKAGWLTGALESPVTLTLDQEYFFGVNSAGGELNVPVDKSPFCEGLSEEGSYVSSLKSELVDNVALEDQAADRYGLFGVSYLP